MAYSKDVKEIARRLDPECWKSYSGKDARFKRAMEPRRTASLQSAQAFYDTHRAELPGNSVLDRHPLPWRLHEEYPREEVRSDYDGVVMDAYGQRVLGSSEWLVAEDGVLEFIIETVNALQSSES